MNNHSQDNWQETIQENKNEKIIHQSAQAIMRAFSDLAKNMESEAKKFNQEHRLVTENLERGGRITKHRINL